MKPRKYTWRDRSRVSRLRPWHHARLDAAESPTAAGASGCSSKRLPLSLAARRSALAPSTLAASTGRGRALALVPGLAAGRRMRDWTGGGRRAGRRAASTWRCVAVTRLPGGFEGGAVLIADWREAAPCRHESCAPVTWQPLLALAWAAGLRRWPGSPWPAPPGQLFLLGLGPRVRRVRGSGC